MEQVNNQIKSTLMREKRTGKEYGSTFEGVYYKNLEYYTCPVRHYIYANSKKLYYIADLGGGSGIVGGSVLKAVFDCGKDGCLDVYDINPKQLEGVESEAKRNSIDIRKINVVLFDILNDSPEKQYDIAVMRKVLHYFPKTNQEPVIKNTTKFLLPEGILIIGALVSEGAEDKKIKNLWFDTLESYLSQNCPKRYIIDKDELWQLLCRQGYEIIRTSEYPETFNSRSIKEKYMLSNRQVSMLDKILLSASDDEKNLLNLSCKDGIIYYELKTKVYVCARSK